MPLGGDDVFGYQPLAFFRFSPAASRPTCYSMRARMSLVVGGLFGGNAASATSGGLSSWLGPMLAGGAGGTVLADGLRHLISGMSNSGHGQAAQSWVGTGPNQDISKSDLAKSIGADDLNALSQHSGLSQDELLEGLRTQLPQLVDKLTPEGRLPTEAEASRWV
jgi:uncharacterized protein YidB (DUF937 family)